MELRSRGKGDNEDKSRRDVKEEAAVYTIRPHNGAISSLGGDNIRGLSRELTSRQVLSRAAGKHNKR